MAQLGVAPKKPTAKLVERVESHLGRRSVDWHKPHAGLTPAQRFVVRFDDGSTVFVKAAVDPETETWLRTDHRLMSTLGTDFVPEVAGWIEAGPESVLLLEDLRDAYWPAHRDGVKWRPGDWARVVRTLERLREIPAPGDLSALETGYTPQWPRLAEELEAFHALRLCSERWIAAALDDLLAAEAALDLSGDALVHNDVRSDNLCVRGDRVILVDWSEARRGSPRHDLAIFASGGPLEGGPDPFTVMPDGGPFAAWRSAWLARRAIHEQTSPAWLRAVFRRAAIVSFQWAASCLDLAPWDGPDWWEV